MLNRSILILALIALLAPLAGAQSIGLGPQVGFQKAADADNGNFMIGADLRFKLSPALGIEGSINYRQEKLANEALTVRSWPIMVTGLIYPLPVVYGAIGAGWHNTTFDFNSDVLENETKQEFGWHFGGGIELPISSNVKLTGDIRYVFIDYNFDEIPFEDVNSNFYVISGGLLFGL